MVLTMQGPKYIQVDLFMTSGESLSLFMKLRRKEMSTGTFYFVHFMWQLEIYMFPTGHHVMLSPFIKKQLH